MGDRVKEIRKALDLNQNEFGARLGVTGSAIARIEKGERTLTDQMKIAICREFGVDPEWLEKGAGRMYAEGGNLTDLLIDQLLAGESEAAKAAFKGLARRGGEDWQLFKKFILDAAAMMKRE